MDKFGRNYEIYIQRSSGESLRITLPFTIEFDISRKIIGSANTGSFRIYNLSAENRNELRFNISDYTTFRSVKMFAGYGTNLSLIFSGNITEAWSVREGVNYISQIQCFDSGFGFVNSPFEGTFAAGTDQVDIIKNIAGKIPGVSVGSVSDSYSGKLLKSNAMSGNAMDLITGITGQNATFIDNGKLNCLQNNECLPGDIEVISSEGGLIGTPHLEQGIIHFDMIFEPRILNGQLIKLESASDKFFNGFFKVTSLKHVGTISSAVAGNAITSVGCLAGIGQLQTVLP